MTPECYKQAAHEHSDRIHSYAVWLLRDLEEARDVTQDALMKLWINHQVVAPEAARAWLLKTVYRMCMDRVRRRIPRPLGRSIDLSALTPDHSPVPEQGAITEETRQAIGRALGALPIRDRAIILLREIQALSYEELSAVLDMPLGSVKATLHRARARLRDEMLAQTSEEVST